MAIDPQSKAMDLSGKVVLVTGASSGIGRAIARRFAGLGAKVVVADVNEAGGAETVQMVEDAGGEAAFIRTDVTSLDDAYAAVAFVRSTYGQLDVMVNNAGWDVVTPFVQTEPAFWDKVIGINFKGQLNFCRAAFEAFLAQETPGRIINMASDAGRVGQNLEAVYSACKGGVIAMTKALAREGARYKILVNAVAPGITDTPLVAGLDEKMMAATIKAIPLRRMGDPDEPAELVAFLAGSGADYITGQVISVNGGLTMI